MVGRFNLPSLPSLPQGFGLSDFIGIDTSPQVFYPSRPSSRAGPSSASASCPSSPAPRRRQRPLSMGDARILFAQASTLPPFNPAAHPHTNSPLESTRDDRALGLGIEFDRSPSEPTSPLLSQSTLGGTPLSRSQHRRSQSAAPSAIPPLSLASPSRARTLAEPRNPITSTSAASLPTLDENAEGRNFGTPSSPLKEPLWMQGSLRRTQTLPRGRRGGLQPLTIADTSLTPSMSTSTSSSSLATITAPSHHRSNSSISSLGAPRRSRSLLRHQSSNSVAFPDVPQSPNPAPVCTSTTSVSDIAAQATWSQEPLAQPSRLLTRSQSVTSPSKSLRERLRSFTAQQETGGQRTPRMLPSTQLGGPLTPTTPRSTQGTPGHGTPMGPPAYITTPGSSTPTSSSHHHGVAPLSPTPTRRRPAHLTHKSTHSVPDALVLIPESTRMLRSSFSSATSSHSSHNLNHNAQGLPAAHQPAARPTTSRLRQPAQLTMPMDLLSPLTSSTSRQSLLEPQVVSPLSTSPGSMVSDASSGTDPSSPTTSVEDMALGHSFEALRERELNRERELSRDIPDLILHLSQTDDKERDTLTRSRRYGDSRRHSRDIRELVEPRESTLHQSTTSTLHQSTTSTLHQSTSSSRMSLIRRSQSLRESTRSVLQDSTRSALHESTRSTLRESTRASLHESTRSNRSSRSQRDHQGHGTSHAHVHNLHSSTSSYHSRERRDSFKDPIHHPTHGTRVVVSAYDQENEDRFLDFDDI